MTVEIRDVNVEGFCGRYRVTSDGDIISIKRGKRLYQGTHRCGYKDVKLCADGKSKTFKVHRLVAIAFIPNPNNYPQVNHINGIKDDNRVENLEWVTNSMNQYHANRNNLIDRTNIPRGENTWNAKFTDDEVIYIRKQRKLGRRIGEVHSEFRGTTRGVFEAVWYYQNYKHLTID